MSKALYLSTRDQIESVQLRGESFANVSGLFTSILNVMEQLNLTQINDVYYLDRFDGNASIRGALHFTISHILFVGASRKQEIWLCSTYPQLLCLPRDIAVTVTIASAKFRSMNRLPVLTYLHPNGKSALCRSSQPLAGISSRSSEDQALIDAIRMANPDSRFLHLVDTRPVINAFTNRARGKGYENQDHYRKCVIQFFDIQNIHVVRSSFKHMLKVWQDPVLSVDALLSGLDKSGWLRHLELILDAAYFVANRLEEGCSVLVHCSDGWDRTAQVCSLAQLIADPYYRTINGLQALIVKDWLAFGHKFTHRLGLLNDCGKSEVSPIFTQFLDCLHHLVTQFPAKFEYNDQLLIYIHTQVYAADHGTFVGCSDRERDQLKLSSRTYSLWPELVRNRALYLNPFYEHCELGSAQVKSDNDGASVATGIELIDAGNGVWRHRADPLSRHAVMPQLLRFWSSLYLQWEWRLPNPDSKRQNASLDLALGIRTLGLYKTLLKARIGQLTRLIANAADANSESSNFQNGSKSNDVDATAGNDDTLQIDPTSDSVSKAERKTPSPSTKRPSFSLSLLHLASSPGSGNDDHEIPPPSSLDQLQTELDAVASHWTDVNRFDTTCSCCTVSLTIAVCSAFHCHQCGQSVCVKCLSIKRIQSTKTSAVFGDGDSSNDQPDAFLVCSRCTNNSRIELQHSLSSEQQPQQPTNDGKVGGEEMGVNKKLISLEPRPFFLPRPSS